MREYTFSPSDIDVANNCIYFATPPPVGSCVVLSSTGDMPLFTPDSHERYWVRPYGNDPNRRVLNHYMYNSDARSYWIMDFYSAGTGTHKLTVVPTTVQSGRWSAGSTWLDGVVPVDGDFVVIDKGHEVWFDVDMSGWTGLRTVLMDHNTESLHPMLYWKNGATGYMKIRAGSSKERYVITTLTENGWAWQVPGRARILMNADGDWDSILPLSMDNPATIEFVGTGVSSTSGNISAGMIVIRAHSERPSSEYVEMWGEKFDFVASAQTVDLSYDYWSIDLGVTPPPLYTPIRFKAAEGAVLPAPLEEGITYFVNEVMGTKIGISGRGGGIWEAAIRLSSTGSGTITVYTGVAAGAQTINVWSDVSGDDMWGTADPLNDAVFANEVTGTISMNTFLFERVKIAGKTASTITLQSPTLKYFSPGARLYITTRSCNFIRTGDEGSQHAIISQGGLDSVGTYIHALVMDKSTANSGYGAASGSLVSGTINGVLDGLYACAGYNVSIGRGTTFKGTVVGAGSMGLSMDADTMLTGTVCGCNVYGVYAAATMQGTYDDIVSISGRIFGCSTGVYVVGSRVDAGGDIVACQTGVGMAYNAHISADVVGCTWGISPVNGGFSSSANVRLCLHAYQTVANSAISGTIKQCYDAFTTDEAFTATDLSIDECVYVLRGQTGPVKMYGCSFTNCRSEYNPGYATGIRNRNIQSFNHNRIPNAIAVYCPSGTVSYHTGVNVPNHRTYSHMFVFNSSASAPMFVEWDIMNFAATTIRIVVQAKNYPDGYGGSLDKPDYECLRWAIIDLESDPTYNPNLSYVDSWQSLGNTLAWQEQTLVCTRTSDKPLRLRVWAWRRDYVPAYAYCYVVGAGGISFGIAGTNVI